jgi:hypothetical protein
MAWRERARATLTSIWERGQNVSHVSRAEARGDAAPVSTARTGRGSGEPTSRTPDLRLCVYRRLTRNGNSLTIAIPQPFRHALKLFYGDYLEIVLDEERGCLIVTPTIARAVGPPARAPRVGAAEHP